MTVFHWPSHLPWVRESPSPHVYENLSRTIVGQCALLPLIFEVVMFSKLLAMKETKNRCFGVSKISPFFPFSVQ